MPPKASTSRNSPMLEDRSEKLGLTAFLKLLTSKVGLTTQEAFGCASQLIKSGHNIVSASQPNPLSGLSEVSLVAIGVTDPDVRKTLVAYGRSGRGKTTIHDAGSGYGKKRKLGKDSDLDAPLPTKAAVRDVLSLEFNEETEDYLLHDRSVVVNRAPVMLAWSVMVAERLGFTRPEALSIAHTYTNMNATAKGVSLGIYSPEKGKERTTVGPSQPYVQLMGRQIPVLSLQNGEWRGIANGAIAEPEQAFGYIQRSFRQNMSATMGALKLLADSIDPDELNKIGYQLYAEFRPEVQGWGEKAQLKLATVLDLRRVKVEAKPEEEDKVEEETPAGSLLQEDEGAAAVKGESEAAELDGSQPSPAKKVKQEPPPDADLLDDDDGGLADSDLVGLV